MKYSISICLTVAIVIAVQTFSASNLNAQDSDRKDRDHERRLRSDFRNEQWQRKFNVEDYLKSQDDNKDGVLSPDEMNGRRTKKFLESLGIPTGRTSKLEDLVKGYKKRIANDAQEKRKEFESRLNNLAQFGAEPESFGVGQFGTADKGEGLRSFEETATGMKASDFAPEMLKQADKRLEAFDRDKNGFLDGDEISRVSWKSPPPETSDLNRDGRLSKLELAKRFTVADQESQKSSSNGERNDDRRYKDDDRERKYRETEISGRYGKRATPKPTSGSAVAKAKANARSTQGYAKYVNNSFKKYDANSDGMLDKKEISVSPLLKKAEDSDGDGLISKQEAIALVSGGQVQATSATPSKKKPKPRKPAGRRKSATASNPSGKRSSLSNKDTNADGQIQMHEYTDTWTAEKLEEFREKDKNGDGLLSPAEYRGEND